MYWREIAKLTRILDWDIQYIPRDLQFPIVVFFNDVDLHQTELMLSTFSIIVAKRDISSELGYATNAKHRNGKQKLVCEWKLKTWCTNAEDAEEV